MNFHLILWKKQEEEKKTIFFFIKNFLDRNLLFNNKIKFNIARGNVGLWSSVTQILILVESKVWN